MQEQDAVQQPMPESADEATTAPALMTEEAPAATGEAPAAARAQDLPHGDPAPDAPPAATGEAPAAEPAQAEPGPMDAVLDAPETATPAATTDATGDAVDAAPADAPMPVETVADAPIAAPDAPIADLPAEVATEPVAPAFDEPFDIAAAPALADQAMPEAPAEPVAAAPDVPPVPDAPEVAAAPGVGDEATPAATEDSPPAVPVDDGASAPLADDRPQIGPKILTDFVPRQIDAPPPLAPSKAGKPQPERPRRRRVTSAQRHRNVFFQRLNELRRTGRPPKEDVEATQEAEAAGEIVADAPELDTPAPGEPVIDAPAPVETPAAEAPAEEAPPAVATAEAPEDVAEVPVDADVEVPVPDDVEAPADVAASAPAQRQRPRQPPPPVDRPRLIAAIERVGGEEIVREALKPKRDEEDQPMKWAVVCADAARGVKPGDPVYTAWLRLAATPVSAIKTAVGVEDERRGGRRGGPGRGGPRRDGGGRDDRRGPRQDRGERVSADDLARLGSGGRVGANIRIVGADDDDKKAREQRRKEQREAKRQAERERLARLGY